MAIARAFIYVSTDAVIGADQRGKAYYKRIYDAYKERKPKDAVMRPFSSVETRLKNILTKSTRFAACYQSVKQLKKSGISYDDEVRLATALYNKKTVEHPREDVGPPFIHVKAWELLRDLPKFQAAVSGPIVPTPSDSCPAHSSTGEGNSDSTKEDTKKRERPEGRKKAKADAAMQAIRAKKLKLVESAVRIQQQHVAEITRRNEILLFANGPGGAESDMAKKYFELKQKETLRALEASMETRITSTPEKLTGSADDLEEVGDTPGNVNVLADAVEVVIE